jgi:hypothetical protein
VTRKNSVLVLAGFLVCATARADAPALLPVQGILTDAQGLALDGTFALRFSLHDAETGGNQLFTEIQSVAVDVGLFNAYLGAVEPLDLSLFRSQSQLWLELTVAEDPPMSRIQLGTTPYSGFSQHSSHSAGTGIEISVENVISATLGDSIAGDEIEDGTITRADLSGDGCASGQILQWDGSAWVCASVQQALDCVVAQCQVTDVLAACTVSCPDGYTVTGCGVKSGNPNFVRENSITGNGCRCSIVNIVSVVTTCQASCCRVQ